MKNMLSAVVLLASSSVMGRAAEKYKPAEEGTAKHGTVVQAEAPDTLHREETQETITITRCVVILALLTLPYIAVMYASYVLIFGW